MGLRQKYFRCHINSCPTAPIDHKYKFRRVAVRGLWGNDIRREVGPVGLVHSLIPRRHLMEVFGEPEVCQHDMSRVREENISGLDIAMDDPTGVKEVECNDLGGKVNHNSS
jgi:hypothetical protein